MNTRFQVVTVGIRLVGTRRRERHFRHSRNHYWHQDAGVLHHGCGNLSPSHRTASVIIESGGRTDIAGELVSKETPGFEASRLSFPYQLKRGVVPIRGLEGEHHLCLV